MQTSGSVKQRKRVPIGFHVAIVALALSLGAATFAYAWLPGGSATGCYVSLYSDPTPLIAAAGQAATDSPRCERCVQHSMD